LNGLFAFCQDFAVLLMRTSYAVADELDFVAMDKFQKDFFLFRQAEYLDYLNQLQGSPMAQGEHIHRTFVVVAISS
jgi:hypothetical protein